MMNSDPEDTFATKFKLETVEQTTPPEGIDSGTWFRYVIGRGTSKINGAKLGTLRSVTEHAESVVEDLNERANKHGSIYVSRTRK